MDARGNARLMPAPPCAAAPPPLTLMPGSSMEACSLMPTPLRTTRSDPSLSVPLQHTSCPWP